MSFTGALGSWRTLYLTKRTKKNNFTIFKINWQGMKQTCKIRFERPNELTLFEEYSLSKKNDI